VTLNPKTGITVFKVVLGLASDPKFCWSSIKAFKVVPRLASDPKFCCLSIQAFKVVLGLTSDPKVLLVKPKGSRCYSGWPVIQ
jgi:hypothetical protein